jgi:hypothetical protein
MVVHRARESCVSWYPGYSEDCSAVGKEEGREEKEERKKEKERMQEREREKERKKKKEGLLYSLNNNFFLLVIRHVAFSI